MAETQEVTPEFVTYIRERDAALQEVEKARAELRETQCMLYDAMSALEALEKVGAVFKSREIFNIRSVYL